MGSNPSAVESVFFSTERFSNSLNIIIMIADIYNIINNSNSTN